MARKARKDVGLRIRIDKELREAFVVACRAREKHASEVLRDFMGMFVEQTSAQANQLSLPLDKES
jgi:hypothetical protein